MYRLMQYKTSKTIPRRTHLDRRLQFALSTIAYKQSPVTVRQWCAHVHVMSRMSDFGVVFQRTDVSRLISQ